MREILDQRILGAIRWVDAVSQATIALPLVVRSDRARFTRNLSGLTIVTHAAGLENYPPTFDLDTLPADQVVANGAIELTGEVEDPTGTFLPARFTFELPRDPSPALLPPDNHRPPNSLFTPIDIALLPSPAARLAPGCAQVRVLILDDDGNPIRNALARVVATAGGAALGFGLSDHRGEALAAVPGLKHFAPGATADDVVSVETEARLKIVHPPDDSEIIDWTELKAAPVAPGDTDPQRLQLSPGALISRRYPFTT